MNTNSTMNVKHIMMRIMVWHMRWMTRYFGFIAQPLVAWYADQEVIACGLRSTDGDVRIIYMPVPDRLGHTFHKKSRRTWIPVEAVAKEHFTQPLVHQVSLSDVQVGDVCIVRTQRKNTGRIIYSPKITIKERTLLPPDLLVVKSLPGGQAHISWEKGEQYDPMVYFLTVEEEAGNTLSGIYTREHHWEYPRLNKASLSLGTASPPLLQKNNRYTARVVIVDFDGWVSCIAKKTFVY